MIRIEAIVSAKVGELVKIHDKKEGAYWEEIVSIDDGDSPVYHLHLKDGKTHTADAMTLVEIAY